jgi:HAE1 family hydrophobic/amphiphilic exporter-1
LYGKAKDAKELEEVAITPGLKLRDVGYAEFGEDEKRGMARFMGEQAVALIIYKQSKTNTVATADKDQAENGVLEQTTCLPA